MDPVQQAKQVETTANIKQQEPDLEKSELTTTSAKKAKSIALFILSFVCIVLAVFSFYQSSLIKNFEEKTTQLTKENQSLNDEIIKLKLKNETLSNEKSDLILAASKFGIKLDKTAYLTFDDGPSQNTERILDILYENNVKATFFIVGRENDYYRDLYSRMINEGHVIAPHSYSHVYSDVYASFENFVADQTKVMDIILKTGAKNPYIMRAPGGTGNALARQYGGRDLMNQILEFYTLQGYKFFDWNVDSGDSLAANVPAERIAGNVITAAKKLSNPVILMHDAPANMTTPDALEKIILQLKSSGYKFDVLSGDVKPVVQTPME